MAGSGDRTLEGRREVATTNCRTSAPRYDENNPAGIQWLGCAGKVLCRLEMIG
jgi:hypothetical protein